VSPNSWLAQIPKPGVGCLCPIAPIANPGEPKTLCEGETTTLDGSASSPCDASGLDYRWLDGTTEVCPLSPTPTCDVTPTTTTTYTLEVTCRGASACGVTRATVTIVVVSGAAPDDLGNTLRAVRRIGDVDLSWAGAPRALTYNLYRGTAKGSWPPPHRALLPAPTIGLPDVLTTDPLYFYRATGVSCALQEGP